jgi:molybdopterin converting factor subunit 1
MSSADARKPGGVGHAEGGQVHVRVRLFAMLRERAGTNAIDLALTPGSCVADALEALRERPALAELLTRLPIRVAVNRDYAEPHTILREADELALIPPVSGGAQASSRESGPFVRVGEEPPSLERLAARVADECAGAIVIFQGGTREVERLEYEAYVEMAERQIERILADCISEHALLAAAVEHRVGEVPLGEPSVVVAVSAAHRDEAFAGARAAIDRIKAEAPIWKREHSAREGARWV